MPFLSKALIELEICKNVFWYKKEWCVLACNFWKRCLRATYNLMEGKLPTALLKNNFITSFYILSASQV